MRQGSRFIIRSNNFNIVSLSMRKLAKMGCRIWADIESPRVNLMATAFLKARIQHYVEQPVRKYTDLIRLSNNGVNNQSTYLRAPDASQIRSARYFNTQMSNQNNYVRSLSCSKFARLEMLY